MMKQRDVLALDDAAAFFVPLARTAFAATPLTFTEFYACGTQLSPALARSKSAATLPELSP